MDSSPATTSSMAAKDMSTHSKPKRSKQDNSLEVKAFSLCDHLLEVLIDCLPFEDKFKLKSVSKQFKRCANNVITRETVLIVGEGIRSDTRIWKPLMISNDDLKTYNVDINSLTAVLKTMTNIRDIRFGHFLFDNEDDVMNAITDNCHQLQSIHLWLERKNKETFERFGQKFGQSLRSIEYRILYGGRLNPWAKYLLWSVLGKCSKLDSLSGRYCIGFDKIVANNPNITHLDITCAEEYCLKLVSQLSKLKSLSINTYGDSSAEDIKTIATNCKQLKSFGIKTGIEVNANQFMSSFKHFQHLFRLDIELRYGGTELLTIDALKGCHQLTHLTLKYSAISDTTLADIAHIVPNLRNLHIHRTRPLDWTSYNRNVVFTDRSLISVSALKNLRSFHLLGFTSTPTTDIGFLPLIENCFGLKDIQIYCMHYISHETIGAIIEKGQKFPKMDFRYHFSVYRDIRTNAQFEDAVSRCRLMPNITLESI